MTELTVSDNPDRKPPITASDFGLTPSQITSEDIGDFANRYGFKKSEVESWRRAIDRKKQVILYGPPGTGKTFAAKNFGKLVTRGTGGEVEILQLHSSYSYADFIEGIRPVPDGDGNLQYPMIQGRFLDFCEKARNQDDPYVLVLDEINRADLSEVFGELMYLLEYRGDEINLAQKRTRQTATEFNHDSADSDQEKFTIPENLLIIGTMNTADRSIALVDFALRRRFAFLPIWPKFEILYNFHEGNDTDVDLDGLVAVIEDIHEAIEDRNFHLGITFFLVENLGVHIEDIWRQEIEPYLEEYFVEDYEQAKKFSWDEVKADILP
jgi:5-methylcytosine-specific restriction protein B